MLIERTTWTERSRRQARSTFGHQTEQMLSQNLLSSVYHQCEIKKGRVLELHHILEEEPRSCFDLTLECNCRQSVVLHAFNFCPFCSLRSIDILECQAWEMIAPHPLFYLMQKRFPFAEELHITVS
ncbi:hypothetical protein AAC387_Pa09g1872 [Persea americana]